MERKKNIMTQRTLEVIIAGQRAGTLSQTQDGLLSFAYKPDYNGPPLSVSMRVANRIYTDKQVRPFLFGLLPDDHAIRRSLGAEFGVSGNNPFELLGHVGLDCPGAIQICHENDVDSVLARAESLEPIDEDGIALRLKQGRLQADAAWIDPHEHWSLGGQQSKFALRFENGTWNRCLGSAATTHIFKGGIRHLEMQALNEYLCMELAKSCGIPAAGVTFREYCGEPAIVIERYDRIRGANGAVVRLHQEDFCQALGVLPENKYPENGGPGATEIIGILKTTGNTAASNIALFVEMLFFNYLIAAPDAHAKNYSLLFGPAGEAVLAPLYDVASMLPYVRPRERMRVAMSIGGKNRVGRVGANAIARLVETNALDDFGIGAKACKRLMTELAGTIPVKLKALFNESADIPGVLELEERMMPHVASLCETELKLL